MVNGPPQRTPGATDPAQRAGAVESGAPARRRRGAFGNKSKRVGVLQCVMSLTDVGDRAVLAGELVRAAAGRVRAPDALRERLEAQARAARGQGARRSPWAPAGWTSVTGACVAILAAACVVLFVALPGRAPAGPSVARAAGLGVLPPQSGAPGAAGPGLLDASRDGVPFPDWRWGFGWQATGSRVDRIDGRTATTVFYAKGARSLAYTIVGGTALAEPSGRRVQRGETTLRVLTVGARDVITWRRRGRTCIVVARGVPRAVLVRLATWKGAGVVPL